MTNILRQLGRWRSVERLVRLAWGGARVLAVVGTVLAVACLVDWATDRYSGTEAWRKLRRDTVIFAPRNAPTADERWFSERVRLASGFRMPPSPVADETPMWLRAAMTSAQVLLALGLVYALVVRPWRRTPVVDDLALTAEKAIPAFNHRLVTAVQLNRPSARTAGMSPALIKMLTREAEDLTARHNLLGLIDYRRLLFAALVLLPVLIGWGAFVIARPELAGVLLQRQALQSVEIPRGIKMTNVTRGVWAMGDEVEIEFRVEGEYEEGTVGRVRIEPDGQPEEHYDLTFKERAGDGAAIFRAKLPATSIDFDFSARLGSGRTRHPGRVTFEPRPGLAPVDNPLTAEILLPPWVGVRPDGGAYVRRNEGWASGKVAGALPMSNAVVRAQFNKPIKTARLIPVVRDGTVERDYVPAKGSVDFRVPDEIAPDRRSCVWEFPTTPGMIRYRIELTDDHGFTNTIPISRDVEMLADRPPVVNFLPETTAHPDPNDFEGRPEGRAALEWGDKMPLAEGGRVMVIYTARSDQGIGTAKIAYRVIPRGVAIDEFPEAYQQIKHPRDDPDEKVFKRLDLKRVAADPKVVGKFVPDLGLFEQSWKGLNGVKRADRMKVNVEFYALPSPDAMLEPAGLEGGGRYMFEIDALTKVIPDPDKKSAVKTAKLEVGDTVELYVEVRDKNPLHGPGSAGYTETARSKIVVTKLRAAEDFASKAAQDKRLDDKLKEVRDDQLAVFLPEYYGEMVGIGATYIAERVRIFWELQKPK